MAWLRLQPVVAENRPHRWPCGLGPPWAPVPPSRSQRCRLPHGSQNWLSQAGAHTPPVRSDGCPSEAQCWARPRVDSSAHDPRNGTQTRLQSGRTTLDRPAAPMHSRWERDLGGTWPTRGCRQVPQPVASPAARMSSMSASLAAQSNWPGSGSRRRQSKRWRTQANPALCRSASGGLPFISRVGFQLYGDSIERNRVFR